MARKKQKDTGDVQEISSDDEMSSLLIKSINTSLKGKFAYNLNSDDSPTHVKRYISTGSKLLNYCIANKKDGGIPEGRLIEIAGEESCVTEDTIIEVIIE